LELAKLNLYEQGIAAVFDELKAARFTNVNDHSAFHSGDTTEAPH